MWILMTSRSEELFRHCLKTADGWVVRTLKREYNSVIPSCLITGSDDVRIGEKLLSVIVGFPVQIRKTEGGYICERK